MTFFRAASPTSGYLGTPKKLQNKGKRKMTKKENDKSTLFCLPTPPFMDYTCSLECALTLISVLGMKFRFASLDYIYTCNRTATQGTMVAD